MTRSIVKLTVSLLVSTSLTSAAQPAPPTPAPADQPPTDSADAIQRLQQQNEALDAHVKALEAQVNQSLKAQADQAAAEKKKHDATAKAKPTASVWKLPEWVLGVATANDLRLRYDQIHAPDSGFVTRSRYRPRLRVGAIVALEHDLEIGFRLASAPTLAQNTGGDPLSTNQSFEDNASRKPVGIDWAFARWTPIHTPQWTGSIAAGKLENPPNFSEDVFDVDYTPEGVAQQVTFKPNPDHAVSLYAGQFMLDELATNRNDPFLLVEQLHVDSKWGSQFATAFNASALTIHHRVSLASANVPDGNHGNTRDASGGLVNDYQLFIGDASVTYNLEGVPGYRGGFPIKLYGEFIHNFGASSQNTAYSVGPTLGSVSTRNSQIGNKQRGNWELSYRYQKLEGDANYEELTASDNGAFYRTNPVGEPATMATFKPTFLNGLNLRGHAFRLAYAPVGSLVVDFRLWWNEAIVVADPAADRVAGARILFDLLWKF